MNISFLLKRLLFKQRRCMCAVLTISCLMFYVNLSQAEAPHAQIRALAPGVIAIDWEHPNDGASSITVEREDPPFTWVYTALVNSANDLGLQPSRIYKYRVCALYGQRSDCTPWLSAQTLATPPGYVPPEVPRFTNSSTRLNSVTVSWTSPASYSFHQVRWAMVGQRENQNKVTGRSFTLDDLRPGTYRFVVQGCNRRLVDSTCSRFSEPILVIIRGSVNSCKDDPAGCPVDETPSLLLLLN